MSDIVHLYKKAYGGLARLFYGASTPHNTVHIFLVNPRVPQCLPPRRNCDPPPTPLPQASMSPPEPKGGGQPRLRVRGWLSNLGPNSNDWRKSLALCLQIALGVNYITHIIHLYSPAYDLYRL